MLNKNQKKHLLAVVDSIVFLVKTNCSQNANQPMAFYLRSLGGFTLTGKSRFFSYVKVLNANPLNCVI